MPPEAGPYADELQRLRAWSVSAWRHGERQPAARRALDRLARLASAHDGIRRPSVPDVGPHGLVDQLEVLMSDARQAGAAEQELTDILSEMRTAMGLGGR